MKNEIDVSVYVLTYYHEQYIVQCLESILSQKTDYTYEIVISDDCSQDRTMDILEEYKNKYPSIIRVKHNEINIGIPKNIYQARCMCRGRYITVLSGDDYWIDDCKLQKQVEFLDKNPEYLACCNAMEVRYDDDTVAFDILPKVSERNREFTLREYEKGEVLYTHGFMMKNVFLTNEGREYFSVAQKISDKVDDAVDNVLLLKYGRVYVLDLVTDVYRAPRNKRQNHNYNSRYTKLEKIKNSIELMNNLYKYFGDEINFENRYANTFSVAFLHMLISCQFKDYIKVYKSIPREYRYPFYKSVAIKSIPKAIFFVVNRFKNRIGLYVHGNKKQI